MAYQSKVGAIPVTYQVGWTLDGPLYVTHEIPVHKVFTNPYNFYKR